MAVLLGAVARLRDSPQRGKADYADEEIEEIKHGRSPDT